MVVPGISCGKCQFCREGYENLCVNRKIIGFDYDGAFAEYVRIPEEAVSFGNVKKVSSSLELTSACLVEPFTAVYNGQNLLNIGPGDVVGIIGAGPIGIMHLLQARARGAALTGLIEISSQRLAEAKRFNPDFLIDSSNEDPLPRVQEMTAGLGFDVVIVACAVAAAQRQALELARPGGRVSFFAGLPHDKPDALLNTNYIHYKQLAVFGANGSGPNQYGKVLRFLESGRVNLRPVVTAEIPLEEAIRGFEMVMKGEGLKVVVHPN
ncbi:MAG: zinc-binding dehydrogenase [Candidatus Fermentithermobacillus carboniphilus]|uniref:Zinc-binding dehydrogenase n=1 Tax=Candidatus Fermentithermobacillus carboniphilus TaxID=3085328 RepID=A0AAT9LGJ1_9FIRM|nr:MAG: zinc-binding dehydrogenase [Candidatus Fermentithermobacillus carboniphilus]